MDDQWRDRLNGGSWSGRCEIYELFFSQMIDLDVIRNQCKMVPGAALGFLIVECLSPENTIILGAAMTIFQAMEWRTFQNKMRCPLNNADELFY